jgi:hypothetical protein
MQVLDASAWPDTQEQGRAGAAAALSGRPARIRFHVNMDIHIHIHIRFLIKKIWILCDCIRICFL